MIRSNRIKHRHTINAVNFVRGLVRLRCLDMLTDGTRVDRNNETWKDGATNGVFKVLKNNGITFNKKGV